MESLFASIEGLPRTAKAFSTVEKDVRARVDDIAAMNEGVDTSTSLSATWELVYTTEKETLFIADNASFFGTEAGPIYQVSANTITNTL